MGISNRRKRNKYTQQSKAKEQKMKERNKKTARIVSW